uniref:Uncharacterized protein n=1 Tax=Helianthus annuus TaxID=4232 RepID=A0A251TKV2_HELAN
MKEKWRWGVRYIAAPCISKKKEDKEEGRFNALFFGMLCLGFLWALGWAQKILWFY